MTPNFISDEYRRALLKLVQNYRKERATERRPLNIRR